MKNEYNHFKCVNVILFGLILADNSGSAMQQLMRGTMHLSLQSHQQPLSQQHLLSHKQRYSALLTILLHKLLNVLTVGLLFKIQKYSAVHSPK